MTHNTLCKTLALLLGIMSISPAFAAKKKKGKKAKQSPKQHVLKEPKGGWENLGPFGILATQDPTGGVTVQGTEAGSPAAGKFQRGEVISSIGGVGVSRRLSSADLTNVIDGAEAGKNGGKIIISVKNGKDVTLQLPELGSYSSSAPYNCPKTDTIVTMAAEAFGKDYNWGESTFKKGYGSSATNIELLGLMATGEQKYQDIAFKIIKRFSAITYDGKSFQTRRREQVEASGKGNQMLSSWSTAYDTIVLAEYYLLTKDETVLPALKTYALSLADGQDSAGLYGHKMVYPETNRAPGYGQMNQVSIACLMGMQLAKKCGINVPGLDAAIGRSQAYVEYHVNKGGFPYGFHGPRDFDFNNNGTSGSAAICMALAGNKDGARFFATMAAAAPKPGSGHASTLFSSYWSPAGVNVAGPEVTQKVFPIMVNYLTPRRRWDGSFIKGYKEGRIGGVALLAYSLPRKALIITGRGADESIWLDEGEAAATVAMGNLDPKTKAPSQLLNYFGHPNPVVRQMAVEAIKEKLGLDAKSLKKASKEPKSRKGIKEAAKRKASVAENQKLVVAMNPALEKLIASGTGLEKQTALKCFLLVCPAEKLAERLAIIGAIMKDQSAPDELRAVAANQLASKPEHVKPYFKSMLSFLLEDRPDDRFAEIDCQIGNALNTINKSYEWDPFKAGLVTDKDLYYKVAVRLMEHKRQQTRGAGVRMVASIPREDLSVVINQLDHILQNTDKTYHSYHSPRHAMDPATQIFIKHNIREGVGYLMDTILNGEGKWAFQLRVLMDKLPKYGVHAKPVIPQIMEHKMIKVMYEQARMAEESGKTHRFIGPFKEMLKTIEESTDGPELISVQDVLKEADR